MVESAANVAIGYIGGDAGEQHGRDAVLI